MIVGWIVISADPVGGSLDRSDSASVFWSLCRPLRQGAHGDWIRYRTESDTLLWRHPRRRSHVAFAVQKMRAERCGLNSLEPNARGLTRRIVCFRRRAIHDLPTHVGFVFWGVPLPWQCAAPFWLGLALHHRWVVQSMWYLFDVIDLRHHTGIWEVHAKTLIVCKLSTVTLNALTSRVLPLACVIFIYIPADDV